MPATPTMSQMIPLLLNGNALVSGGHGDSNSGGKRDRVYCARALMEILEEPAKLAP